MTTTKHCFCLTTTRASRCPKALLVSRHQAVLWLCRTEHHDPLTRRLAACARFLLFVGGCEDEEESKEWKTEVEEEGVDGENWGTRSPPSTCCCRCSCGCFYLLFSAVQLLPGFYISFLFVHSQHFIFSLSVNITGCRKSLTAPGVVESSSP